MNYKRDGRSPFRSYLNTGMDATRKGWSCTVKMGCTMQLCVSWITYDRKTRVRAVETHTYLGGCTIKARHEKKTLSISVYIVFGVDSGCFARRVGAFAFPKTWMINHILYFMWDIISHPCPILYYNTTVWILAGNYISFTIAAGLIRLHMPGVKKSRV